jgi:hypothetical protein
VTDTTRSFDNPDLGPAPDPSKLGASDSGAALRMRRHRERRRRGLRCLLVELRAREIESLIQKGLLKPETRNSARAITAALYAFLDRTLSSTP